MNINDIHKYLENDNFVPKFIIEENRLEIIPGAKYVEFIDNIHSEEIYTIINALYVDSMSEYFKYIKDDIWKLIHYELMDNISLSKVSVYMKNEDNIRKANRQDRFIDIFVSKLNSNYPILDNCGLQFEIMPL